jgi:hypothetical protein
MGATSVTGKGRGSADGSNKGSTHMTLGVSHLVGPRVVAAGAVTLSSTAFILKLPLPTGGAAADYVCMATDQTGANAVKVVLSKSSVNADGSYDLVATFTGTSTDVISYAIIKTGVAG